MASASRFAADYLNVVDLYIAALGWLQCGSPLAQNGFPFLSHLGPWLRDLILTQFGAVYVKLVLEDESLRVRSQGPFLYACEIRSAEGSFNLRVS